MSSALGSLGAGAAGGGGAAAGLAIPGLNALLLPLLLSFGPAAISKLFGGQDPQQKLRDEINRILSANNTGQLTNQFYNTNLNSPAYSQAQGNIATGANTTANTLASSLGARGLSGSGTRDVLSSLTPSLIGSQQAGLKTAAWTSAQSQAEDSIQRQIQALMGTSGPTQNMKLFAGGLESFGPYLQAYLRAKFPSLSTLGGNTSN